MAIPNELSSDIAVAMLAEQKSSQELRKLKDIVLLVHGTLQELSKRSLASRASVKTQAADQTGHSHS